MPHAHNCCSPPYLHTPILLRILLLLSFLLLLLLLFSPHTPTFYPPYLDPRTPPVYPAPISFSSAFTASSGYLLRSHKPPLTNPPLLKINPVLLLFQFEDLSHLLFVYESWAHRMLPKFTFAEIVDRLEAIGSKREVHSALLKMRNGQWPSGRSDEVVRDEDDDSDNDTGGDRVMKVCGALFHLWGCRFDALNQLTCASACAANSSVPLANRRCFLGLRPSGTTVAWRHGVPGSKPAR